VSLSRSLGGAHGAQAGLPHPFAGLLLTHGSSLPSHTLADTDNARHDRDRPGSRYATASRPPDRGAPALLGRRASRLPGGSVRSASTRIGGFAVAICARVLAAGVVGATWWL
jgi:hypothetical protein